VVGDVAAVEDQYVVGVFDGGHAVGDDEHAAVLALLPPNLGREPRPHAGGNCPRTCRHSASDIPAWPATDPAQHAGGDSPGNLTFRSIRSRDCLQGQAGRKTTDHPYYGSALTSVTAPRSYCSLTLCATAESRPAVATPSSQ
jgi:hypothetical protein